MKRFIATTAIAIISAFISIQNYGKKNDNAIDTSTTNTHRSEVSRRNLAAGIHEMMGGELALRVDNSGTEEFFSSNPFMPREYVGTGTAFIHFKNATEQDAEGETTFPPSKSPMAQYSGWFTPTEYPSRVPTKYPAILKVDDTHHPSEKLTPDPSRKPTQNPNSFSAYVPSRKPSKMPTKGPTKRPSRKPTGGPTKEPTRGPSKLPTRFPSREPTRRPTREPSKEPTRYPSREPSRMPTRYPSRDPTAQTTKGPTLIPMKVFSSTTPEPTLDVKLKDGNFYCGSSVYEAGKCELPCPNGIVDCHTGFCYAVSECSAELSDLTPQPSRYPTKKPTDNPTAKPSRNLTNKPTAKPSIKPTTSKPTRQPSKIPSRQPSKNVTNGPSMYPIHHTDTDFYCGGSLMEASSECKYSCPTGSPVECPNNLKCYASPGCKNESNPPLLEDPSGSFYCGSSFQMASEQCLKPCPSGVSSDCPPNEACYANTPCDNKNGFFCGTSIVNASASCEFSCHSGLDNECPSGLTCYETETCRSWGESKAVPTISPRMPKVEEGTKYCGYSYQHAATMCTQPCPSGAGEDCPVGMSCYTHTPCEETTSFYCGLSWNNAASNCETPCPSGTDSDCPSGTHCYAYTTCDETDSFMCGTNFEEAASLCDKPCPSGSPVDCPATMSCFAHTTCAIDGPSILPPSPPYIPGDSFFCGESFHEASSICTKPCPTRSDSECPEGEHCYGNTPCPSRATYYCGVNLEEASALCDYPCPTGGSEDCPNGLSCFAFTTCADKDSFFCGNNFIEADSNCEIPCPSGMSSDCPDNLTCFAHTTCPVEQAIEPSVPTGSHFCGNSFDEATRDCSLPCPTGSDTECPGEMGCFPHTSCTDRDSFMCGYSWDHAAGLCTNPCPSGEHDDCPEGMSCFAYTPCNNAGSFFCGNSFDEASSCEHPCPSGNSLDCPNNLSCFSYTSCGTGAFNSIAPTSVHAPIDIEMVEDSFYCGTTFEDASRSCKHRCPNSTTDCPLGLACFEFTSCVGQEHNRTGEEHNSFFCGSSYTDANEKCEVPCPGGTSLECPFDEMCIPFTTCNDAISSTFYCGTSKENAEASCEYPCPVGPIGCPNGMSCFSLTACATRPTSAENPASEIVLANSFYCGTSFENATSACSIPCSSGSSLECPIGLSCYGYTSCSDKGSFYCGKSWDEASSVCLTPCPSGRNDECGVNEFCFGYTPCNNSTVTDIPTESFYCGASFTEASMLCSDPCPSGKHSDCPVGQLCHPYTPCGERDSFFCGSSWADAATSCLVPCPSGSSSECPESQHCFPSTPCDEVDSFYCGTNFDDASTNCNIPCESGHSNLCPYGQGCFAYTLCDETGKKAVPTPSLAPIPSSPAESFYCGASFEDASSKCKNPCPSGRSEDCPGNLLCFASTPCNDRGSFFCGSTWEEAAVTCAIPCENGLSSDCPAGQLCFGYTPCSLSESFYCGASFEEASASCSDVCPSGADLECPGLETCHKYTSCNDITPLSTPSSFPMDSFYCGVNFVEAASKCYLPCPTGSAAECPIGEACYGNTPCNGGDSFYCGVTWYDASSECLVPCPSGLDEDCPHNSKCFGYTPCSDTSSFFCGIDFYDASTTCARPCPSGSSSECPLDLSCFPNTPCGIDPSHTLIPSNSPNTKIPILLTPPPTLALVELKTSSEPQTSMFLYCGLDINSIDCLLPCLDGDECPLGHECYATHECSDSFYCGDSFSMANTTCSNPCPDGRDETCPKGMKCYAQTSCSNMSPIQSKNIHEGSSFCGRNFTDASTSCQLQCSSSAECTSLGFDYSCFANTPCGNKDSYYCGITWSHASSNCLFPCPSGDDSDCPEESFCFPYTSCDKNHTFMCGASFNHASLCEHPCPSGSSSECPFGQSCFTHTACSSDPGPDAPLPILGSSYFCGESFLDAATQCSQPCPSRLDSECPGSQKCFANTQCHSKDTYFCGTSLEDASATCKHPCPTGHADECPGNLSCFAFTTCADRSSYFCGTDYINASSTCNTSCESGLSSDCPYGLSCFAFTSCSEETSLILPESAYCGTSFEDASQNCTKPCETSKDCLDGEACFPFLSCDTPNLFDDPYPSQSFYCGTTFEQASMTCTHACPSGSHAECPLNQFCFPSTPCHDHSSFYCGSSWTDASTSCLVPCPSGSSADCPIGNQCFPSTPCNKFDSFFCGLTFTDASSSCSSPCPSGQSSQCPDGLGCFAYTLCEEDGNNWSSQDMAPATPLDSFCGKSFEDATVSCNFPCLSGLSEDCPGDLLCFTGTSCEAKGSFYCGKSWEEAASKCSLPCKENGISDCPAGEKCFGYTPCTNSNTFYCGISFDDASKTCNEACPSGLDSECFGSATCHKHTTCNRGKFAIPPGQKGTPENSHFCGNNFDDASVGCSIPCPSRFSTECPVGQACFAHTTCSMANPESFFCGKTLGDANLSCTHSCPSGSAFDCPSGMSCFAYTSCAGDSPSSIKDDMLTLSATESPPEWNTTPAESHFCGISFEDASTQCAHPCPRKRSEDCPHGMQCFAHTTCISTQPSSYFCGVDIEDASQCAVPCNGSSTECPSGSNCYAYTSCSPHEYEITSFASDASSAIPNDSYFCGLSYEDASHACSIPCSGQNSLECPALQQCYAYTPCAKPESFFCGSNKDDANQACAIPCPSGKSNTCPLGESCYAYTACEPATHTNRPPSNLPTKKPTLKPTLVPTMHPTFKPTLHPTIFPSKIPSKEPTHFPTILPTMTPTKLPTKYPTELPTKPPIVPVLFDVPEASFYCGVTFNHASELCGVACLKGNEDCPPGLTCFGNTPCGDKNSFFCGVSYEDANMQCTEQCPNGSADECPSGQSCFAYTKCKLQTESPIEPPTFEPTRKATFEPTKRPIVDPTSNPSKKLSPETTLTPSIPKVTASPTDRKELSEMKEEPGDSVEQEVNVAIIDEEKLDQQEENQNDSEALMIELKPCADPLAMSVNQAYWRSWSSDRPEMCNKFEATDIDATTYTHLVYSFASISADGHLEPWVGSWDEVAKYKEFNKVKELNPNVKTIIAVTEGIFYGPGMNPFTFNEVAETEKSRWTFAQSVVVFLDHYNFDGIDIDWESPLNVDKGGGPNNYERFVLLVKEIRSAFASSTKEFVISVALPPTEGELHEYDVIGLSEQVDWFNLMSYDYHTPKNIPKTVGAHSDLKLIDSVVFSLLQGTESTKFVLGMAAYGRTYTLADHRCHELGCPFSSPGLGGCGNTPGFLPFNEIHEYIHSRSYDELHRDVSSSSTVLVVDKDQMISFDDETTWAIKEDYAEMMCLRGTMLWSVDMLIPNSPAAESDSSHSNRLLSTLGSSPKSCDICGQGTILLENKSVSFAEKSTTCGEVSSLHHQSKELSFKCSIAKTTFSRVCCAESCHMCPHRLDVNADAMIDFEGKIVSCIDLQVTLSGFLHGSNKCDALVTLYQDVCCGQSFSPLSISTTPCSICMLNNVHHELKSEAEVEYKGKSISCLDVNSILSNSEIESSEVCSSTQSFLFDDCCYEKCTLCGNKSLRWDKIVKYNNEIISCNELSSMFTMGIVRERSEQCDAMQSAYSNSCCFEPPKKKCGLCNLGSMSLEVNTHSFVKTKSSSLHCVNLSNALAEREEEGSKICEDSKLAYSMKCCNTMQLSPLQNPTNIKPTVNSSSAATPISLPLTIITLLIWAIL